MNSFHHSISSSASWLSLGLCLLLFLLFGLFLLLFILLVILPLQALHLLLSFWDRLEKPLQPSLLISLQVLCQSSCTRSDSVFTEAFLCNEELDKAFDVGLFPFEVAFFMVGRTDIGGEEQFAGFFVGPVFGNGELSLVFFDSFNECFESAVFTDEFEGSVRTDFRDGIEVIAAKENTEINKLQMLDLK